MDIVMIFASCNVVLVILEKRKLGENIGYACDPNCFLLENWYSRDMIPGNAKNVHSYSKICAYNLGV
jgi:hypothetical protein